MSQSYLELQKHLVICGWKPEMAHIVQEILKCNSQWTASDVVLISKVDSSQAESFRENPTLKDVKFIFEEPFSTHALEKAQVKKAERAIVLADWSNKDTSVTETDAKTVMAAMAIERMAPKVYLVAELLDPNFAMYLKMANADEIIYSREYSRFLLANAIAAAGVSHVVYDLLDVPETSSLETVAFPEELIGHDFKELSDYFENYSPTRTICIGVLENTGNVHELKKQALSAAQKNPDTRTVLRNLRAVKDLEPNLPKINPGDDYKLKSNSMAVIVRAPAEHKLPQLPEDLVKKNLVLVKASGT